MHAVECRLEMVIKRYDGWATLYRWCRLPRVPVAGDYIYVSAGCDQEECVRRVILHPNQADYAPTVWVYLTDDVYYDRDYDQDDFCGIRPQKMREGIGRYLDEDWKVHSLATVWCRNSLWGGPSWATLESAQYLFQY